MPDYSKCVIYKLCCNDLNIKEIYVGSTCNFINRKHRHKCFCYNENGKQYHYKVYKFIRDNGGFENWNMVLVEEFSCENKQQKLQRERYWYEELKATLNGNVPGRGKKEYSIDFSREYRKTHQEQIKEYDKQYRERTGEERNIRRKETMTCECGSVVRKDSIRKHERTKKHLNYINKN